MFIVSFCPPSFAPQRLHRTSGKTTTSISSPYVLLSAAVPCLLSNIFHDCPIFKRASGQGHSFCWICILLDSALTLGPPAKSAINFLAHVSLNMSRHCYGGASKSLQTCTGCIILGSRDMKNVNIPPNNSFMRDYLIGWEEFFASCKNKRFRIVHHRSPKAKVMLMRCPDERCVPLIRRVSEAPNSF